MAVDKDMSHSLSQSELGILLWILNGVEPKDEKLYNTILAMDSNGDAAIELGEWLDFISSFDENGKRVINYELKEKFDKYDLDGNGTISIDEMQIMLLDSMKELLRKIGGRGKKMSEAIIEDLAKMCMKEMDVDGSDSVDWMEFKKHYKVAMKMEEKAKEYLKKFIDEGEQKIFFFFVFFCFVMWEINKFFYSVYLYIFFKYDINKLLKIPIIV